MLSTASQRATSSRIAQTRAASLSLCKVCQQKREFRFGPWGSRDGEWEASREALREVRRQNREMRYRYMESLQRRLWEDQDQSNARKEGSARGRGSDVNQGASSWFDSLPRRTGKVHEQPRNDWSRASAQQTKHEFETWRTPLKSIRGFLSHHQPSKDKPSESTLKAHVHPASVHPASDQPTEIDPITNRRIPTKSRIPAKASFTPKFEDVDQQPNLHASAAEDVGSQRYSAAKWNEPDGLPNKTPEERSKQYKDLHKYRPVRWAEPDGLQKATPEEMAKQYGDLDQYGAIQWNEPDGLPQPTPEELTKNYEDLGSYGASRWNEPDGLRQPTPEEESKKYQDLSAYDGPRTASNSALAGHQAAQNDTVVKGHVLPPKVEVATGDSSAEYKDLDGYQPVYWNEPDGLRKLTPEEESKKYDDLDSYGAVRWNEPDGLPQPTPDEASRKYDDLRGYAARDFDRSEKYDDLRGYAARDFDRGEDGPVRLHPEEASKNYQDLGSYGTVMWDEPDGLQKRTAEEESKFYSDLDKYSPAEPSTHPTSKVDATSAAQSDLDSLSAEEIRANVLRRAQESSQKLKSQDSPATKLTGNYVRDFPEEFTTSWSTQNSNSKSSLFPSNKTVEQDIEEDVTRDEAEASSMDESFPTEELRLEPALNRHARKRSVSESSPMTSDPYSTTAQGLETSYREEVGAATQAPEVKHYGSHESPAAKPASPVGPRVWHYKILAYDPQTDSVRMVEATSAVEDTSRPQTPGEIIPRLANPARFLSYFANMEAQGYQLLSGSDNTLVFRQVREATSGLAPITEDETCASRINPIDLMGQPVTGNFASPTGFVNYDSIAEEKVHKPAPPFRSLADVHREEESGFSAVGASSAQASSNNHNKPKKKNTLARNLVIGTAWAGGTACALGVVGEYFASRGAPPRPGVAPDARSSE